MDPNQMIKKFILENDSAIEIISNLVKVIIIFVLAKLLTVIIQKLISKLLGTRNKIGINANSKKLNTIEELLKNITSYVIYFIAILSSLDTLGVQMKTVLAVAGAASVAIGLGAQNIIKDIIAGFFILFEDQFSVGDYITIDNMSGTVEVLGLRITKIRDFSGDLHIIPNGSILKVTNKSRGNMRALVDIQISYSEDLERVNSTIEKVIENIKGKYDYIKEGPSLVGVVNMTESAMTVRVVAKTEPMMQWGAETEIRRAIKEEFDKEGITMPFQKMVFVNGEEN